MGSTWIVDVEATGKFPTSANLLQIAALKYDRNVMNWEIKNWYFTPRNPIPFEVKNLTGLTEDYLREQSDGLGFEELCDEVQEVLLGEDNLLIGHNIKKYDSVVIKNNFSRAGVKLRTFPEMYDTMLEAKELSFVNTGKWIKLGDLFNLCCEHFKLDGRKMLDILVHNMDFNEHELKAHNAKFDILMNALVYYMMEKDFGW